MPYYRAVGDVPRKRHTIARRGGNVLHEELMGTEGFSSASALLYHRHSPSAIVAAEAVPDPRGTFTPNVPLLPHHLRTTEVVEEGAVALLGNDDVVVTIARVVGETELYRNAGGDELVYVQSGQAVLASVFGRLAVGPGDYVVIPTSTTHRWEVASDGEPLVALVIESSGHVAPPRKYLSASGQFLEHAPYCERDIRAPGEPLLEEGEGVDVLVRHRAGLTRFRYATHPFDVLGWDGALYPWAFNISDFEPIVGRLHQPPPVHQTFELPNAVVCSFVPRLYDFHPEAIKVPYHHANVDSDEVLFYSQGNFMSRAGSGIDVGSISLHPAGFVHGPQPGSLEAAMPKDRTEEVAVMLDTFRPLGLSDAARAVSADDYPWTWARRP